MSTILPKLRFSVKERLAKNCQRCRDAKLKIRYLIILLLSKGRSAEYIARNLLIHRDTVYRVAKRFREDGEFALLDRRSGNGANKLKGGFLDALDRLVRGSPQDHRWLRPTWTRDAGGDSGQAGLPQGPRRYPEPGLEADPAPDAVGRGRLWAAPGRRNARAGD